MFKSPTPSLGFAALLVQELRWLRLLAPIFLRLADVALVAELGQVPSIRHSVVFWILPSGPRRKAGRRACSGMELLGLVGVGLFDGEVTNLTEQERTEQREQSKACLGYA